MLRFRFRGPGLCVRVEGRAGDLTAHPRILRTSPNTIATSQGRTLTGSPPDWSALWGGPVTSPRPPLGSRGERWAFTPPLPPPAAVCRAFMTDHPAIRRDCCPTEWQPETDAGKLFTPSGCHEIDRNCKRLATVKLVRTNHFLQMKVLLLEWDLNGVLCTLYICRYRILLSILLEGIASRGITKNDRSLAGLLTR